MAIAGELAVAITGNLRGLKASFKETKKETRNLQKSLQKAGKKMSSVGKKMTMFVTGPAALMAAAVGKIGMDFEDSLNQSIAIMGDVSDAMREDMADTARDVADELDVSNKEAAQSYYYLASAGLDAKQSIAALPQVAEFATAGQFEMATATDLLTDAQSALGLSVEDTQQNMRNMSKVSDVLVKANTIANASVQQFSESLTNDAAAALRSTNKSIEEGVAVLGVFADQGRKGQRAGRDLARAMRYMRKAARENTDALKEHNVEIFDNNGNMRNMADIVADLETSLDGMTDKQQDAALAQMGFNAETQQVIKSLMGTSDQIRKYQKDLKSAGGTTQSVADKQMESIKKQLGLVKDQFVGTITQVFKLAKPAIKESLIPALESLNEKLEGLVEWFSELSPGMQKFLGVTGLIATALGPVLWALGSMTTAISALIPVVAGLAGAFGPLLIGGAVVGGVIYLKNKMNNLDKAASDNLETTQNLVDKYDKLKSKTNKTAEEKEELRKVTSKLAELYPDAVEGINDETGAYRLNTEEIIKNAKARNLQQMSNNIQDMIDQINDEVEALEKENERIKDLNENTAQIERVVRQAQVKAMKIIAQAGMEGKLKADMSLEDFINISNDSEFEKKLNQMPVRYRENWKDALATLRQGFENTFSRNKDIEKNNSQINNLNEDLVKQEKILKLVNKRLNGLISSSEFEKRIVEINNAFSESQEEVTEKTEEELDNQNDTYTQFNNGTRKLSEGLTASLRDELAEREKSYLATMKAMAKSRNMTAEEVAKSLEEETIKLTEEEKAKWQAVNKYSGKIIEENKNKTREAIASARTGKKGILEEYEKLQNKELKLTDETKKSKYSAWNNYFVDKAKQRKEDLKKSIANSKKIVADAMEKAEELKNLTEEETSDYKDALKERYSAYQDKIDKRKKNMAEAKAAWQEYIDKIKNGVDNIGQEIKNIYQGLLNGVVSKLDFGDVLKSLSTGDIAGAFSSMFGKVANESSIFNDTIESMNNTIMKAIKPILPTFNELFKALEPLAEPLGEILAIVGEMIIDLLKPMLPVIEIVLGFIADILEILEPLIEPLAEILAMVAELAVEILKPLLPVLELVADAFEILFDVVKAVWNGFVSLVNLIPGVELEKFGDSLGETSEKLSDNSQFWTDRASEMSENMDDFFGLKDYFKDGKDNFDAFMKASDLGFDTETKHENQYNKEEAKEVIQKALKAVRKVYDSVKSGLTDAFSADTTQGFLQQFGKSLKQTIKQNLIKGFMESEAIKPMMKKLSGQIFEATSDDEVSDSELAGIQEMYDGITEKASGFFDTLKELDGDMNEAFGIETESNEKDEQKDVQKELKKKSNELRVAYDRRKEQIYKTMKEKMEEAESEKERAKVKYKYEQKIDELMKELARKEKRLQEGKEVTGLGSGVTADYDTVEITKAGAEVIAPSLNAIMDSVKKLAKQSKDTMKAMQTIAQKQANTLVSINNKMDKLDSILTALNNLNVDVTMQNYNAGGPQRPSRRFNDLTEKMQQRGLAGVNR